MRYSGLLWNSATNYSSEILSVISKDYPISRVQVFNLNDCLDSFVKDIYTGDSIADWKVNKKIECLHNFDSKRVTVFDMDIPVPVFKYVDVKKRETCAQIENLKRSIRGVYSQKIQPYFFDTIIHISDDQRENILMQKVLKKYENYRESDAPYKQSINHEVETAKSISVMDILRQRGGRN